MSEAAAPHDAALLAARESGLVSPDRPLLVMVSGGGFCTYSDAERFFSYRRVRASGRMGAFIWIA